MTPRHIAVIDVGKTNAKLALVDARSLSELAVVTRPNHVIEGPPYRHIDLEGHWAFFLAELTRLQSEYGIDAISVTTHGAAAVLLDAQGQPACPMLDYEDRGPEELAADYEALRPPFARTGSPRLGAGLNLGAQLHWLLARDPALAGRVAHIVTYPQYWGFRLTGEIASDVTSLGCHTDLWEPQRGRFSDLPDRLGVADKIAPPRRSAEVLGPITPKIAALTGMAADTPVHCGIHDSNASLYPHLLANEAPFSVVSTGTWVVAMAVGSQAGDLDPDRDLLVNVDALGRPVPSGRYMGGRAYELISQEGVAPPTPEDRAGVLARDVRLMPSVSADSGPFKGRHHHWTSTPRTPGERMLALSWYLALVTRTCLDLARARGPVIIEGPFARNDDFAQMLAILSPEGVRIAGSATGTSIGAALLVTGPQALGAMAFPLPVAPPTGGPADAMRRYAAHWSYEVGETTCA
ncbi:FGGY-family carbohydrate kinase (plasmid) [Thioclava sp. 'Guangxiensis']|uniref:FGGY-family carbohydrate kinase n=1 Tax=Thioclava sp. 'Guangxiensis' TaxID=3149044 RepID=UPI0032C497EE